jgi:hypothetical protein
MATAAQARKDLLSGLRIALSLSAGAEDQGEKQCCGEFH